MTRGKKGEQGSGLRGGVAFLTLSGILAKVLGFAYKVPLNAILGDEMASVNAAAALFAVLYTATAAGIPGALSLSIAEAVASGNRARIKRLFDKTLSSLLGLGFVLSLALLLLSHPIARLSGDAGGFLCTVAIAPALFFTAGTGVLRGFFQGFSRLVPTAASALLEALGKTVFGILLAFIALNAFGKSHAVAAALSVFGVTLGIIAGTLYLAVRYRREGGALLASVPDTPSPRTGGKSIFRIALPITLTAMLMSLSSFLDAGMMRPLLSAHFGDEALGKTLYSDYSTGVLTLYNMPLVLVSPIATALVPYVSGRLTVAGKERARGVVTTAMKLTLLVILPAALGLSAFSRPILAFVFRSDALLPKNVGGALSLLAPSLALSALITLSTAVLQGAGRESVPILSLGLGILVKVALMPPLVALFGTLGIPLATIAFYAVACFVNQIFLYRTMRVRLPFWDGILRPLLCSGGAVTLAYGTYRGLCLRMDGTLALLLAIGTAAVLYLAFLIVFGAVSERELAFLPHGSKKISNFLRPFLRKS